jgi:hypothetical protein
MRLGVKFNLVGLHPIKTKGFMIYAELQNYLQRSSPDTVQVFDDAVVVFEKYEVPEYMGVFETTLEKAAEQGDQAVVDALLVTLTSILDYLLKLQGIVLSDEVLISERVAYTDAMFELAYYEDRTAMTAVLDSDLPVTEKFAELMAFMTPYSAEETLGRIEEIGEDFISNFKEVVQGMETGDMGHAETVSVQIKAYTGFKQFCKQQPLYADKYFSHLAAIGLEFADYLKWYQNDHNDLSVTPVEQIAKDLIGLACLSSDGCSIPLITIRNSLSGVFSDLTEVGKLDVAVTKVILAWGTTKLTTPS